MRKAEIRTIYKSKRSELDVRNQEKLLARIVNLVNDNFNFSGKILSIFLPIARFNEIDTWKLIEKIPARFAVPVVTGEQLRHILIDKSSTFKTTDWGIPEPESGREVQNNEFDAVFVPLLAFDLTGQRVGYGKGFYDKFLKSCRSDCQKIGLSWFPPVERISDSGEHDICLDFCVSPDQVFTFSDLHSG